MLSENQSYQTEFDRQRDIFNFLADRIERFASIPPVLLKTGKTRFSAGLIFAQLSLSSTQKF